MATLTAHFSALTAHFSALSENKMKKIQHLLLLTIYFFMKYKKALT